MKFLSTTLIILSIFSGEILSMPPAQCNPSILDDVPPKIRKVCDALNTIYQLGMAMENYIIDKAPLLRDNVPMIGNNNVKRQDVDHVFLRFGRR